ncbi:hypothetical protein MMC25_006600 [Agyrium rufum]|nr:hypothetical protein [Agyrium rufum]
MLSGNTYATLRSFRFRCFVLATVIVNAVFLLNKYHSQHFWTRRVKVTDYSAGNQTLGFQKILAVAPNEVPARQAWRREGLLKAAAFTGLEVQIPLQPTWSDTNVDALMNKSSEVSRGYALSWLGHLHAIKEAANYSTSLILEDDVDWDLGLREQMPRIAEVIRLVTDFEVDHEESIHPPYGTNWDVLWLGHCGDSIGMSAAKIEDPTVPPYFKSWETRISPNPDHTRWVHRSTGPICTYAYALTDVTAKRILDSNDLGTTKFDIWLHIRCKRGIFQCITVNPELFHHHEVAGEKDSIINGQGGNEVIKNEMTENIWHSARCNSVSKTKDVVTCMGPEL